MPNAQILVYIEDPGAANMVVGLADTLRPRGVCVDLWAAGTARNLLAGHGTVFQDASRNQPVIGNTELLVIGTSESPDSIGFDLAAQIRASGGATAGLVDSPANAATRFRGTTDDPLAHVPDHLIVTDEATRSAFVDLGVRSDRISLVANPALLRARARAEALTTPMRAKWREALFGPGTGPIILFLTELSDGLEPESFRRSDDYTMIGRGSRDARTDIVLETLLDTIATLSPKPRVVLRLHPKECADSYHAYANEIDGINVGGDPLDACAAADLVIGMTTTLLSEARQLGQRTMSMIPRAEERGWLADLAAGQIPTVTNPNDVAPLIEHLLSEPIRLSAEPAGAPIAKVLTTILLNRPDAANAKIG